MKIVDYRDFRKFNEKDLTLVLGFFDGVHLGHKKVINKAIEVSKNTKTKCALLTFNCPVYDYINHMESKFLTSFDYKIEEFMNLGIDELFIIELSDDFINLSKEDFYKIFLKDMKNIVVGFDYTFGLNKEGNTDYLKTLFKDNLFIVDKEYIDGIKIGTKEIKEYLSNGNIKKANEFLGRTYSIDGKLHRYNNHYILSYNNEFIPRNGEYDMRITCLDKTIDFIAKIKNRNNELIIKLKSGSFDTLSIDNKLSYRIFFKDFVNF